MIEIRGLKKIYKAESNEVIANNNISFKFKEKGFYIILGKSGCGKTTLLNILSGLDNYNDGKILVDGDDIGNYNEIQLDEYRNIKIGIIFQQYNLLSDMNVFNNLRLVLELQEWECDEKARKKYIEDKISDILDKVGLSGYENRKINQLSGGEQQRIAIARTLLKKPDIIFADEPTGNLDANTGNGIMELLRALAKKCLIVMVSHDKEFAYKYGDYIINMSDGEINSVVELEEKKYLYSFSVKTSDNKIHDYKNINQKQMLDEIEKFFFDSENGGTLDIINIEKKPEIENDISDNAVYERNSVRTKKICDTYKLRLAGNFLRKRKVRLLFTTILTALTVVLLFFSIYICFYDKEDVMLKYMDEQRPAVLPVYAATQYTDDFYIEHSKEIKSGYYVGNIIENGFPNVTSVGKCLTEQTIGGDDKFFIHTTLILSDNLQSVNLDVEGQLPVSSKEIAVTDYVASKINKGIGDKVEYGGCELIITGIVRTDYIEYNLDSKINRGCSEDFFLFKCKYTYFSAYAVNDLLVDVQNKKADLTVQYADFLSGKKESLYFNSFLTIGNASKISDGDLLVGHMPKSKREVVVSKSYLDEHLLEAEDSLGKEYYFKNIYDDIYNYYYSDAPNLYDYYNEGIVIAGVIDDEKNDITKDVYLNSSIWEKFVSDNFENYYAGYLLLPQPDEYKDIVTVTKKNRLYFDEPAINDIYYFDMTVQRIKLILLLTMFVVMAINFIMTGTFVSISINENKKNIGVLRSLGVTMTECTQIFNMEFYAIYLSSIVLATFGSLGIIHMVNAFFSQGLQEVKYDIIKFDFAVYSVVIFLEYLVNFVSIRLPIGKMKKQKPIDTIRD